MTDCTDNRNHRSRGRGLATFVCSLAILVFALGSFPSSAPADGDPASDVLATQPLFLPQDADIPLAQRGQLSALIEAAARSGYQIRVALISSTADLGSVTELWRQPQTYAQFLGQELALVYRGPLLVVMPDGFGLSGRGVSSGAARSALTGLPSAAVGAGLAAATITTVGRLAAASGHPVATPPPAAGTAGSGSSDTVAVIALLVGAALIALAWTASLRARPPRVRPGTPASP